MNAFYELLKFFDYNLDRLAFVIKYHSSIDKKTILKDLEKRNIKPYAKIMQFMLNDIENTIQISRNTTFSSENDYIRYLKELLDINNIDYVDFKVEPRRKRKNGNLFEFDGNENNESNKDLIK